MEFTFRDHITYVRACGRFANDLVSFLADSMELTITVDYDEKIPKSLRRWLRKVSVDISLPRSPEDN